jgi:hypothetical protein
MIFLLWGIISIGFYIYFLVICFRAAKVVREKLGLGITIVLVIGLLSFMGKRNDSNEINNSTVQMTKSWKFYPQDSIESNSNDYVSIALKSTLLAKYTLGFSYGVHKTTKQLVPIQAHSDIDGVSAGTHWKPQLIFINTAEDAKKFEYHVEGIIEWKLLNVTIYAQEKSYKGIVVVK